MKSQLVKKLLRRSGYAILALAALLALFIFEENFRGRITLARYKAELRAKGEKLTLAELGLTAKSPGNESGRKLLETTGRLQQLGRECPFPIFFATHPHFVEPGRAIVRSRDPDLRAGNVKLVAPGDAREHIKGIGYRHAEWSDLAAQVARASNDLAILKTILAHGDAVLPEDLLNPSTDIIRRRPDAMDWLGAEAIHASRLHDLDTVIQDVEAMAALSRVQEQLRSPRDEHNRSDAQNVCSFITWQALQETPSDVQLIRLQQARSATNVIAQTLLVGDIERARQMAEYEETVRSPRKWWQLVRATFRSRVEPPIPEPAPILETLYYNAKTVLGGAAWLGWNWESDELGFLQRCQAYLDVNREALRRRNLFYLTHGHVDIVGAGDCERDLLGCNLNPGFNSFEAIRFETRREMALTAIAIQRFVLRSGHPPQDLRELCPQFLPELPHDWCSGQPLRYRRDDAGFTLYSVGIDGNDDGGHAGFAGERATFWTGKDMVWPQAVSER